ncbi:MAG: GGDEF domain-containing protein, partial [Acidobacteria bacterium]|nr:GGDEF domain-containing protein [Acidobacteriota bacterium]
REQGMLDPLTQVYNRRFFDEVMPKEVRRADRTSRPLSFLLVEVDEFKRINQHLGHFVGDKLLRAVAGLLSSTLRATDYTFRFGGDQFLLALPDTPPQGVAVVVKRLEAKLAAQKELHQPIGRPVTVSFGQATYVRGEKLEAVIDEAERALESARAGAPAARPAAAADS